MSKKGNPDIDLINFQPAQFLAFRDMEVCKRVAKISKEDLCTPPKDAHSDFKIRILGTKDFHFHMALDMLVRIKKALDEGKQFAGVFPTGPIFQYQLLAAMCNALNIPLKHVHYFSMDEYADEDGNDINPSWRGSFHYTINEHFISRLRSDLRIPEKQIHFPSKNNIDHYDEMILEARGEAGAKGAHVVYGGTGLSGHYSFWDPHLTEKYGMDDDAWKKATPRLVDFHPISTIQMAVTDMNGAWPFVPPKAYTTASTTILNADYRSWWNDGAGLTAEGTYAGGIVWQKFITRLALHGPVTPKVPCSVLRTLPGDFVIIEPVAEDLEIELTA
jgi:6-phosphogluconolactonase/glucosamine-6-phosphate isomerase/deaminase